MHLVEQLTIEQLCKGHIRGIPWQVHVPYSNSGCCTAEGSGNF